MVPTITPASSIPVWANPENSQQLLDPEVAADVQLEGGDVSSSVIYADSTANSAETWRYELREMKVSV